MIVVNHPLIRFLISPKKAGLAFTTAEWDELLRTARRGSLLGRIAYLAERECIESSLPTKIRAHLDANKRVYTTQRRSIFWETRQLQKILNPLEIPFIILKGGAYIVADYDSGYGRFLSDLDIMVPKDRIAEVESVLISNHWFPSKLNTYDQRYYRTWMHELPPLRHIQRGTTLDVHHTILPPTAAVKPDISYLWRSAVALENHPGAFILSPHDLIIHSSTHLFHDGDMSHGLRDLVDINNLLHQFATNKEFWEHLVSRAAQLDLELPLYYGIRCCQQFLNSSIPEAALSRLYTNINQHWRTGLTHKVLSRAIASPLERDNSTITAAARYLVYIRSHYLRMPLMLLIPHLLRKSFIPEENRR